MKDSITAIRGPQLLGLGFAMTLCGLTLLFASRYYSFASALCGCAFFAAAVFVVLGLVKTRQIGGRVPFKSVQLRRFRGTLRTERDPSICPPRPRW
jgi:hypothetical protein